MGVGIWRREGRIMRLGAYQLVFLVLVVIRAIATGLRFAPNETRAACRLGHVLVVNRDFDALAKG